MNARVFGVVFGPVRKFKRFRAEISPVDDDGIEIFLFGKLNDNPRRVFRVEYFAPPHCVHVAIGKVAATDEAVVVLCCATVNCFAEESRCPACVARNPKSGAVVFAGTVPVIVIAQAPVRETENRVIACDESFRHVVIAGGRIPDGEIGSQHVICVDFNARASVVNLDDILCGECGRGGKCERHAAQDFFEFHKTSSKMG